MRKPGTSDFLHLVTTQLMICSRGYPCVRVKAAHLGLSAAAATVRAGRRAGRRRGLVGHPPRHHCRCHTAPQPPAINRSRDVSEDKWQRE